MSGKHDSALVAPDALDQSPTPQGVHASEPGSAAYVPGPHATHDVPGPGTEPAKHPSVELSTHADADVDAMEAHTVRSGHAVQALAEVAVPYVSAGQARQAMLLAGA